MNNLFPVQDNQDNFQAPAINEVKKTDWVKIILIAGSIIVASGLILATIGCLVGAQHINPLIQRVIELKPLTGYAYTLIHYATRGLVYGIGAASGVSAMTMPFVIGLGAKFYKDRNYQSLALLITISATFYFMMILAGAAIGNQIGYTSGVKIFGPVHYQ